MDVRSGAESVLEPAAEHPHPPELLQTVSLVAVHAVATVFPLGHIEQLAQTTSLDGVPATCS